MTLHEIQEEADHRWITRIGILAGDRKELTQLEISIAGKEAREFENQERAKLTHEDSANV